MDWCKENNLFKCGWILLQANEFFKETIKMVVCMSRTFKMLDLIKTLFSINLIYETILCFNQNLNYKRRSSVKSNTFIW